MLQAQQASHVANVMSTFCWLSFGLGGCLQYNFAKCNYTKGHNGFRFCMRFPLSQIGSGRNVGAFNGDEIVVFVYLYVNVRFNALLLYSITWMSNLRAGIWLPWFACFSQWVVKLLVECYGAGFCCKLIIKLKWYFLFTVAQKSGQALSQLMTFAPCLEEPYK